MILFGLLVLGIAVWMLLVGLAMPADIHHHHHDHNDYGHHHHDLIDDAGLHAHARAYAADIRNRLDGGTIGTWQTVLLSLSGGVIPCPAAITVFILCLHLGQVALGVTLVSAFSIGLALTHISIGVLTAVGLQAI